jgi:periplasmic protein TonB
MTESDRRIRFKFLSQLFQSKTQPSLFHYVRENPEPSVFEDLDWSFLRHPIRSFIEWRRSPRTKPSLFHYIEEEPKQPFSWKEFFVDLFTGFRNPNFIPSVFSDLKGLAVERAQGRTRRMEAGMVSLFVHAAIFGLIIFLVSEAPNTTPQKENVVMVNQPVYFPVEGDGRDGGGGGGGGKHQAAPPATGEIPKTVRNQMIAPDPDKPQPLMPAEDLVASVQMPIDLPRNASLPIGDITAPPNGSASSGPGSGGGIGTGKGTGIGSGTGAGVGPGSGGGMGGGSGGGIGSGVGPYVSGNGVKDPVLLEMVKPNYTEEGRKARAEGVVLLQAVVHKDGSVDSFKVLRGLGYGLDEQAIFTISTKWRFKPGTKDGKPVDVYASFEVTFRLH